MIKGINNLLAKTYSIYILLTISVLFVCCKPVKSQVIDDFSEQSELYIIREKKFSRAATPVEVEINGLQVALLKNNSYTKLGIQKGQIEISAEMPSISGNMRNSFKLNLDSQIKYYVKIIPLETDKFEFEILEESYALNEIAKNRTQYIIPSENDVIYKIENTENAEKKSKGDLFCLAFDPLNFIIFGPTVTGELILQGKDKSIGFGILSGYRFVNWGLLSNSAHPYDLLASSYSIPLGLRIYTHTSQKTEGMFIGPYMEFGMLRYDDIEDEFVRAFGFEWGVKFIYNNNFTFEMSLIPSKIKYGEPSNWHTLLFPVVSLKCGYTL